MATEQNGTHDLDLRFNWRSPHKLEVVVFNGDPDEPLMMTTVDPGNSTARRRAVQDLKDACPALEEHDLREFDRRLMIEAEKHTKQLAEDKNRTERPEHDSEATFEKATSDAANADRFVARFGHDVRFIEKLGAWFCWDGCRWVEDDTQAVIRLARKVTGGLHEELPRLMRAESADTRLHPDDRIREVCRYIRTSNSKGKLTAMLKIASAHDQVALVPSQLDSDPMLFNVQNGTLDLRTGELLPHRPGDLITKLAPVQHDPDAQCPLWEAFLHRIMKGDQDLIGFLQRVTGYCLTGLTDEQVWFFLYGGGANGKSVFLTTIQALLDDYAGQGAPDLLLSKRGECHPTETADLFGKRLVVCSEVQEGRRFDEQRIKQLTGGDVVKARRMREDFWEFFFEGKLFLAANHRPRVTGTDYAFWRRVRLIPFDVTIPPQERDPQLAQKLKAELAGILNWALQGLKDYREDGLNAPRQVLGATDEYRNDEDPLGTFLEERCFDARGIPGAAGVAVAKGKLYEEFCKWVDDSGEIRISKRELGQRLAARGFEETQVGTKRTRSWKDLGLHEVNVRTQGTPDPV